MNLLCKGNILLLICWKFVYVSSELSCETNDLQALMLRLRQLKTEAETTIKELKDRVEFLGNQLTEAKASDSSVAFHAYNVTDSSGYINHTVVFQSVLLNSGVSYNSSTGVFTAPRNGIYVFHAQVCLYNLYDTMYLDIMVESTVYATAYGNDYYDCGCASIQAVVHLKAKEKVFIKRNSIANEYVCQGTNKSNYFTGMLNFH